MTHKERVLLDGPAGHIEVFVEAPEAPTGIALIAHPHPLYGGTADNKVVTTLARTFRELGCVALRPNFRGVGASEGEHDHGVGETEDLLVVHSWARQRFGAGLPVYLAGFSFGAYVVTRLAQKLATVGDPAQRLVLVGTAAGFIEGLRRYETAAVPPETIVIHGAKDETVPLANVLAWAEPLDLPVVVIPGADHFFHRRLHLIRDIVRRQWAADGALRKS
ncbi:MAG: alpha/beta hydrolase [Rhodocyclaceae bacterium]|jgi:alpha/beta superfamily hydrolase|nr:alpha/beta hydrolase [Rhodocyclaceae bacterium]